MKNKYTVEIVFLSLVLALSFAGFSSLLLGEPQEHTAYHLLHIITSLAWLMLLLTQLVLISQERFQRHRAIGKSIFFAGPVLVATLTLLTVHSAAKDSVADQADDMVVQNVMVALEVALLVLLAFILRKNRAVHGALLLSTALLFMGIALFFSLISYVPSYRIAGPETFHHFAEAAQTSSYIVGLIGLSFFLKNRRTGWPWLLAGSMFFLNGFLQMFVAGMNGTKPLTQIVASIGRAPAFGLGLMTFVALLWLAWRVEAQKRTARDVPPKRSGLLG